MVEKVDPFDVLTNHPPSKNRAMSRKRTNDDVEEEEVDAAEQKAADSELLRLSRGGMAKDVAALLRKFPLSNNAVNERGQSALMFACMRDDWTEARAVVKVLLAKRVPARLPSNDGFNAVHYASHCSNADIVRDLLDAEPNLINVAISNLAKEGWHNSAPLHR